MTFRGGKRRKISGPLVWQKLAFAEDLESDPTLSGVQKGLIGAIAKNYDNATEQSKCSLTFLAAAVGTTKKVVGKYVPIIVASNRVSIIRKGAGTASTLWSVNWFFRGSGYVRLKNGGQPILDCRESRSESPKASPLVSPKTSPQPGDIVGDTTGASVPHLGDQTLSSSKEERKIAGDRGGWAFRPPPGAAMCARLVSVTASDVEESPSGEVARLSLSDSTGNACGELEIVLQANRSDRQDEGQAKLNDLTRVTAIDQINDFSELYGVPFLLMPNGDLMPDPENEKAMSVYLNLYDLANILDRHEGKQTFRRADPDRHQIVAEMNRLAGREMKEAA
ncbi:hypothetical protein EN873_24440 [bacterium M00.F.Ca.ET.230.01.1.1]|nr:hypothetical protein EN873_24440 [bacterium M00.F.Ca.ET.230.01.1.1]